VKKRSPLGDFLSRHRRCEKHLFSTLDTKYLYSVPVNENTGIIGVDFKVNKYAAATAAGIKMTPLLITTAGTMHKTMYKAMKKFFPDGNQRRWVLMDIAIFLARGRGQVYARDLGILEMAAAAEDADVGA
jgi:hypothetical protein